MRQFETTSTVKQHDACILQQYAYLRVARKMEVIVVLCLLGIGAAVGLSCIAKSLVAGLMFCGFMAAVALISIPVQRASAKKVAAQLHPDGDGEWAVTTWFEQDGLHDHEADLPEEERVTDIARDIVCAYRAGTVLLLCTKNYTVLPIDLVELSETDRKSVYERLKSDCPKLKMLKTK